MLTLALLSLIGCSESDGYSDSKSETKPVKIETAPDNWYMRIVATDTTRGMVSSSSQLGGLTENNTVQKHTLKAKVPFSGSYIDVQFLDPKEMPAGAYSTNFHQYVDGSEESWNFIVKNYVGGAMTIYKTPMTLSLRGLYVLTPYVDAQGRDRYKEYRSVTNPLLKRVKLIDVMDNVEVPIVDNGIFLTYQFDMDINSSREFKLVVSSQDVALPKPTVKRTSSRKIGDEENDLGNKLRAQEEKVKAFDLNKPPMFE